MASLNLANIFFFYLFVYIKSVYSTSESPVPPFKFQKDDNYLMYSFEDGVKFVRLEYDGRGVWEIHPKKSVPSSVLFSVKGNTAFLKFNKSLKVLSRDDNGDWKLILSGKGVGTELDLKSRLTTNDFDYMGTKKIHIYTAKKNNLFTVVKKKSGWRRRYTTLWTPNDPRECATKVIYDETKSSNKVLTVHQVNGIVKTFNKTKFGSWTESSVKGCDNELTPAKVEFVIDDQRLESVVKIEDNKRYLKYIFEDGVECLGVEYDGKKVFELDKSEPPISVYFCVMGNTAFVNYKDSRDIFRFENDKWISVYSGKAEGKSLNVLYKGEGTDYYCEKHGKIYTYIPKNNGLFSKVRYHPDGYERVLMEVGTALGMATAVQYEEVDAMNKYVVVRCVNGFIRKFVQRDGRPWMEAPATYCKNELKTDKVAMVMKVKNSTVLTGSPIESYKDAEFLMKFKQPENRVVVQFGI